MSSRYSVFLSTQFPQSSKQILVCFIASGPIFEAEPADQTTKGALAFLVLIILLDIGFKVWREFARIRPPQALKRQ